MKWLFAPTLFLVLCSCATPKPVLAPNRKYEKVGQVKADKDINMCMAKMEKRNQTGREERKRKAAVSGAVGGALLGAYAGAVTKGSVVRGAGGGAIGGAAIGYITGGDMDPETKKNMVNICLEEKGYKVAGWE